LPQDSGARSGARLDTARHFGRRCHAGRLSIAPSACASA